jgi:hypothetical protein
MQAQPALALHFDFGTGEVSSWGWGLLALPEIIGFYARLAAFVAPPAVAAYPGL